jgi:hypothetical protein
MISRNLLSLSLAVLFSITVLHAAGGGPGRGNVVFEATVKSDITRLVGEEVCFTLTARDENGNVIRSWHEIGSPTTVTMRNSTANSDTSTQSWSSDPDGYTWAIITAGGVELTVIDDTTWSIPHTDFVDGVVRICMIHTKAEADIYLEITPNVPFLNQISQSVEFVADNITNYLVDITSAVQPEDAVYNMRAYEIIVAPRDRFLNVSNQEIITKFSARWPGEFSADTPGLADIFSGEVFVRGLTNYLIASRVEREKPIEPQRIMAYASADASIFGITDPYEVRSHAPFPFMLQTPVDHTILNLTKHSNVETFTWERPNPPDPYWDIQISRFNPNIVSDAVEYTWHMVDSISLTRAVSILSNNNGTEPQLSMTHGQIWGVMKTISGQTNTQAFQCLWYVTATDGLYTTTSNPSPGHYISIAATDIVSVKPQTAAPSSVSLGQNYPNPFNPSTTISFSTTRRGAVKLRVYDLLGSEVAMIVNRELDPGSHSVQFDASRLQSGVYVYTLEAEGKRFSRRMVVAK